MLTCPPERGNALLPALRAGLGSPAVRGATLLVAAALVLNALGHELTAFGPASWQVPGGDPHWAWIAAAAVYVIAMALPFIPGIEIGVALMMMLGDTGVIIIYLCTQLALAVSFLAGRLVPARVLAAWLERLGGDRALPVSRAIAAAAAAGRPDAISLALPSRLGAALAGHRYVALGVAINVPGNALLGGAGGLGLLAGASRLFSFPRYCAATALATSPVPLAMLLCGGA